MLNISYQCTLDELFENRGFTIQQFRDIYKFFISRYNYGSLRKRGANYSLEIIIKGTLLEDFWECSLAPIIFDNSSLTQVVQTVLRECITSGSAAYNQHVWGKYSYHIIKLLQIFDQHISTQHFINKAERANPNEITQFIDSLNLTPDQLKDLERQRQPPSPIHPCFLRQGYFFN